MNEAFQITVPMLPPSVNEYRGINWRLQRFYLKPPARRV